METKIKPKDQFANIPSTFQIPHSEEAMSSITVDVLKLAKGNVYEAHESFIRTFEPQWRQDENIILILCAIVLFTPSRPKTIHSDVLKLEQVRSVRPDFEILKGIEEVLH